MNWEDIEVMVGDHTVMPCRSVSYDDRTRMVMLDTHMIATRGAIAYPGWAGIKRRWVPYRLWMWTARSRRLGRSRFVRWLLNRTTWRAP